jgi:hypothetical protein
MWSERLTKIILVVHQTIPGTIKQDDHTVRELLAKARWHADDGPGLARCAVLNTIAGLERHG